MGQLEHSHKGAYCRDLALSYPGAWGPNPAWFDEPSFGRERSEFRANPLVLSLVGKPYSCAMPCSRMPADSVIRAVDHPYRRNILHILARGSLTYSQLFASMEPRGGGRGRFNYHLKVLREASLVVVQESEYGLTGTGGAAVTFLEEVNQGSHQPARLNISRRDFIPLLGLSVLILALALVLSVVLGPIQDLPARRSLEIGWSGPMLVETAEPYTQTALREAIERHRIMDLSAGVDSSGNGIVAWARHEKKYSPGSISESGVLYAVRFAPGFGWGEKTSFSVPGQSSWTSFGTLDLDAMGSAFALWEGRPSDEVSPIYASRFVPSEGWTAPRLLDQREANGISICKIAASSSDHAIATWVADGGRTHASSYSNRGWESPVRFDPSESAEGGVYGPWGCPTLLRVNVHGDTVAIWVQRGGDRESLWAGVFEAATGRGTPRRMGATSVLRIWSFNAGIAPSGDALVAWIESDETQTRMMARRYVPAFGWGQPTPIDSANATYVPRFTGDPAQDVSDLPRSLRLVVDRNGNAVAAWVQITPQEHKLRVFGSRYVPGNGWGPPQLIEPDMGVATVHEWTREWEVPCFSLGGDTSGSAILSWTKRQEEGWKHILASSFTPPGGWSPPEPVGTASGFELCPQLGVSDTGNAIVAWATYTPQLVYANYFVRPQSFEQVLEDSGHLLDQANARLTDLGFRLMLLTGLVLGLAVSTSSLLLLYWYRSRELRNSGREREESIKPPRTGD